MSAACEPVTQVCLLQYDTAQSRVHNPNMRVRLHLRCARVLGIEIGVDRARDLRNIRYCSTAVCTHDTDNVVGGRGIDDGSIVLEFIGVSGLVCTFGSGRKSGRNFVYMSLIK